MVTIRLTVSAVTQRVPGSTSQNTGRAPAFATASAAAMKPVISTPFPHAVELLSGGLGILVERQSPQAIADANPGSELTTRLDTFKRWYSQAGTPRVKASVLPSFSCGS